MAFPKVKALSAALALLVSQAASAVGLGEIKLKSALNEPLNAEIELLSVGDLDELELFVNLASRKDFERSGVPRDYFLSGLRFNVDLSGSTPKVVVKSEKPVREPFLDFLVEMQWPSGRLLRNYTLLIDLPVYSEEKAKPKVIQNSASGAASSKPASQPAVSAPQPVASDTLEVGGEYQVARGDTLWGIARRSNPQGASIHQTMVAIHQLNPRAFVRGDINLLKSGEILRMPAGADINSSHNEALAEISQQTESGALIDATDNPSSASDTEQSQDGRLKLSAAMDEAESLSAENSVSEYQGSEIDGSGGSERISNDLTIAREELARKDRELADERDRIAKLEEQIATMERMIEVGGTGMGETQEALARNQQVEQQPSEQATQTEQAPEEKTLESNPSQPQPQEQQEQGFLAQYKYYLMAGVGLLLALLVALGLRRKKDDDGDEFAFDEAPPEPTFEEPEPAAAIAELNNEANTTEDATDIAEQEEPLSEPEEEPQDEVVDLSDEDQLFDFEEEDDSLEELEGADKQDDEELDELLTRFDEADEELQVDNDDDLDFDVELDLDDEPQQEGDDSSDKEPASEPQSSPEQADAQAEQATESTDIGDDDFDLDMEDDGIGTKLDLAKAYSDVGDADGAREMLEEVIEEGSDEQKAEARKLLDELE